MGLLSTGPMRAAAAAATQRFLTYHAIGSAILGWQQEQGWGSQVIDRLAADLRVRFPDRKGLGPRSLRYMRDVAKAWPEPDVAAAAAKLPWGHVMVLVDRLPDAATGDWYAQAALEAGWSRGFLEDRIKGRLHERIGAAPSNFETTLSPQETPAAQQLTRDPVLLDFLGLSLDSRERQIEQAMVDNISRSMLELGDGLAFVGRQVPVQVDDQEFYIDLLFFSITQLRYVVVELKAKPFDPRDAGQLNFYVNLIDDQRRDPTCHAATIGILLCAGHTEKVVRYALAGLNTPVAVAAYTYDILPPEARRAVPSEDQLLRLPTSLDDM